MRYFSSFSSFSSFVAAIELIGRQYSPDLKSLVLYLLSKPTPTKSIDEVASLLGPRLLNEVHGAMRYGDVLEAELSKELENGRLVRLIAKLGFINERPEYERIN